jgi:PAS domain-containing protein
MSGLAGVVTHPFFGPAVGLVVLGSLFGGVAWWQTRRRRAAEQEVETLSDQLEALREALGAGRDGFFMWLHQPEENLCSRRLSVLLNLANGTDSSIESALSDVAAESRRPLDRAIERLRDSGTPFTMEVAFGPGARRLEFRGTRVLSATDDRPLADILWVRDVTEDGRAVDRLSAETARLVRDQAHLQAIVDALPFPVWVRDGDLSLTKCNAAYARLVEVDDSDAAVRQSLDLCPGEASRELRALAARSRAAGAALSDRFHLVVEGTRRLMEIVEAPFSEEPDAGPGRFTVGVAYDITSQEDLEARLSREQASRAAVLDHLSTAIAIFGSATKLTYHNPAFARLWQLDSDWLLETQPAYGDLLDLLRDRRTLPEVPDYPAFRAAEVERFTTLIEPVEDLVHLPDGTTLRRVIAPQPVDGLLLTYEDVTDALSLERSYNTLSAVQRETLDHLHEAVGVFGADGRLKLANPAFAFLWGDAAGHTDGAPQLSAFLDMLRDRFADENSWRHHRFAVLSPPSIRTPHRGRVSIIGGTVLDYACVPLPDGGVLLSYNDVSDTARVEQALRERAQSLSAASMLRADFIASLSYELRTPLTTIAGFSEVLCGEYHGSLNAQQIDYSLSIAETARDMVSLLDDIADLVTIEAGQTALDVDAFDLHGALTQVLDQSRTVTRRRAVAIEMDCPRDIGWMVGDEARIRQILFHLVSSAIKESGAGSRVRVAVAREQDERDAEWIRLSVSDEAANNAGRRLTSGGTLIQGGSLTMLLVRRFTEMHGGSLTVSPEPGRGTTVVCRLPSGRAAPPLLTASGDETGDETGDDGAASPPADDPGGDAAHGRTGSGMNTLI